MATEKLISAEALLLSVRDDPEIDGKNFARFKEHINHAPDATPKWVPVTERLPESGVKVLCWYEYFRFGNYNRMFQTYGIGYYFRDGFWGGEVSNRHQTKVLAWMPLPTPPKGE